MARAKAEKVSFRWGIPLLDAGFTVVPNFMFSTYSVIGVDRAEFLFILHLARYHYESALGEAHPSLETLAREMGVSRRWVRKLKSGLEKRGLLRVIERVGETNVYEFAAFARACAKAHMQAEASRNSSSDCGNSSSGWGLEGLAVDGGDGGARPGAAAVDIMAFSRKLVPHGQAKTDKSVISGEHGGEVSRNSSSDCGNSGARGGTPVPPPPELQFPPPRNSSSPKEEKEKKCDDDDDNHRARIDQVATCEVGKLVLAIRNCLPRIEQMYTDEIGKLTPAVQNYLGRLIEQYPDPERWEKAFQGVVLSGVRRLDYLEECLKNVGKPRWSKPK